MVANLVTTSQSPVGKLLLTNFAGMAIIKIMKLDDYFENSSDTPHELAKRCNCHVGTIYRIMSGKRKPRKELMSAIYRETRGIVTANDIYLNTRP